MSAAAPPLSPNPYVGARPLEEKEPLFGRDTETRELFYTFSSKRILLFYSPSGAGKSSVVAAGLLPRLRKQYDVWPTIRVNREPQAGSSGNRYVESMIQSLEEGRPATDAPQAISLKEYVQQRRKGTRPVALIFDQFEEILTTGPSASKGKQDFFRELGELLAANDFWALFVMREDYLAAMDPYRQWIPTQLRNRLRLDFLSLAEARKAIEEPARIAQRPFTAEAADQLLNDLATVSGVASEAIEPLHLQVVCRRLWDETKGAKSIEAHMLAKAGDVDHALGSYYDQCVDEVAGKNLRLQQEVRRWFGERLITSSGVRAQVLEERETTGGLATTLIPAIERTHLIRREPRRGGVWYELAHDRLIPPVRASNEGWINKHLSDAQKRAVLWDRQGRPQLLFDANMRDTATWAAQFTGEMTATERDYVDACRARIEEAQRLEEERARRLESERLRAESEAKSAYRLRWALAVLAMLFVLAVVTAGWALWQNAVAKSLDLVAYALEAEDPKVAALLAVYAFDKWHTREAEGALHRTSQAFPAALEGRDGVVSALASSQGWFATGAGNGARIWDDKYNGTEPLIHPDPVTAVALSEDRKLLATGCADHVVRLWDVDSRKKLFESPRYAESVSSVALGKGQLAVATEDSKLDLWDVKTQKRRTLSSQPRALHVIFTPEARGVAAAFEDGSAVIFDAVSGARIAAVKSDAGRLVAVAMRADGKLLATATSDGFLEIWDVTSGKRRGDKILADADGLAGVVFTANGRVVTAGASGAAKVWDPESGEQLSLLSKPSKAVLLPIAAVGTSQVALADNFGGVRVYELDTKKLRAKTLNRAETRRLSAEECRRYLHRGCPAQP